jgi:hypothetical protein
MAPAAPKTSNISLTMTNPRKFGHVTGLFIVGVVSFEVAAVVAVAVDDAHSRC